MNVAKEVVQPAEAAPPTPPPESDQDRNWRRAREQLENSRAKIEQLESQLQEIVAQKKPEEDPLAALSDDDVVTVREARLVSEKAAQEAFQRLQAQRDLETLPDRLKARFPDFDSIVNKENVEKLKATKPELVRVISATTDPYSAAVAAYEFIQATNPEAARYSQYRDRIEANAKKPMSPSAAPSATEHAEIRMGLDKKSKEQRYAEIQRLARRA